MVSAVFYLLFQILINTGFLLGLAHALRQVSLGSPLINTTATIIVLALLGYLFFFIALISYPFALVLKIGFWVLLIYWNYNGIRKREINLEFAAPWIGVVVATIVLALWTHLPSAFSEPLSASSNRWTHQLPIDNQIPFIFAQYVASGEIPSPMVGDWLSSDRPPLQTGLFLLMGLPVGDQAWIYQVCGIFLQMFSLAGIWILARSMGLARKTTILAMATTFFTPLVIVNGSFVWPKLLPAALLCCAVAIHFQLARADSRRTQWLNGGLSGAACALAFLGHGSSAFAIMGIAGAALLISRYVGWHHLLAGSLVFLVCLVPWKYYQSEIDPPGDRLLKWHLAGVVPITNDSFLETIQNSFSGISLNEWLEGRRENFNVITQGYVGTMKDTAKIAWGMTGQMEEKRSELASQIRFKQFFHFAVGLGFTGFCLYLLPLMIFDKRVRALSLIVALTLFF